MKRCFTLFSLLFLTNLCFGQWTQVGGDIDGQAAFDRFADSNKLAISKDGNTIAVGASENDSNGSSSGLVRVYKNINNSWIQVGDDLKGTGINDKFGECIDLSANGEILVVGEPGEKNIVVYQFINNQWDKVGETKGISTPNGLGNNVALNSDGTTFATAISNNILIYSYENATISVSKLISLDGTRNFLTSASLEFNDDGTVLVVGNRQYNGDNDGTEDGRVLVYEKINNNDWVQKGNSIISNNNGSYFGNAVDISADGNTIVLGSPHTQIGGKIEAGFVRTYKFENNDWIQRGNDVIGLIQGGYLGRSVSFNDDATVLAIGAEGGTRGIAQIFKFENNDWVQISSTIIGEASGDAFGSSIAMNGVGNIVAVGASNNDGNGSNAGHVRVFKNDNAFPSITNIPDPNFEQYLVDLGIDSDGIINGQVLTEDINSIYELNLNNRNIVDLTGIQDFSALSILNAQGNSISSIDISQNPHLRTINLLNNNLSELNISNNTKLKNLYIRSNNIQSIDLSNNVDLLRLDIADNQFSNLNISNNNALINLTITDNNISSLDVSDKSSLEILSASNNNLSSLDITNNTLLEDLRLANNQIVNLNITNNSNLDYIDVSNNQIVNLDTSNKTKLLKLFVSDNQIEFLDLESSTFLLKLRASNNQLKKLDLSNNIITELDVNNNKLYYLNLQNGENVNLLSNNFDARNNPNLSCIQVDDVNYSQTNWTDIDSQTTFNSSCPELTLIPDANFETYLESINLGNGIANDGFVFTDLVKTVASLDISNKNIVDLTGIQDFKALVTFNAENNSLTGIDISQNLLLENLLVGQNQISSIDISKNINLKTINVNNNLLTSISLISNVNLEQINVESNTINALDLSTNTKLQELYLANNDIQTLVLSMLTELSELSISNNKFESLNIDNNVKLTTLDCSNNQLTSLDVSSNTILSNLNCSANLLTEIEVKDNDALTNLNVSENQIKILDLSKNANLSSIFCNNNDLVGLNVKNGNNTNIQNLDFAAFSNANLTCIQVDNANYSNSNWAQIDIQTTFNTTCPELVAIPDVNFESYLENINAGNGTFGDGFVDKSLIEAITSLNIDQQNISNLTGIEEFTGLKKLSANNNNISAINLSNNTLLEELYLSDNSISVIDFSNNTGLKSLNLNRNSFSSIDVSMLTSLEGLVLQENQISNLDLSNNSNLLVLSLFGNSLQSIDLSNNGNLISIDLDHNNLTSVNLKNGNNTIIATFSATQNPNLTCIEVDDVPYFESNSSFSIDTQTNYFVNCPELTSIPDVNFETYIESINLGNGIVGDNLVRTDLVETATTLDVSSKNISDLTGIQSFKALIYLTANNNLITTLDLSQNTLLERLFITNNSIEVLNLNNNFALKTIDIGNNQLTFLEVRQLTNLQALSVYNNDLSSINLYSNKELLTFIANGNKLTNVDIRENDKLFWIDLDDNQLEDLMLKNGNNTNITQFSITGNPNLTCVEVDDVNFSTTNWTEKDTTANYSTDCAPANDDCSKAIPLNFGQQTPGDVNSGTANNNPSCASGTVLADVWFSVTVPDTGEFSIEGTGFGGNLKFAIYTSCQSAAPIACGSSISLTNLTVGETFYLKVWLEGSNKSQNLNTGSFTLTASESSVLSVDNSQILEKNFTIFPNPVLDNISIKSENNEQIDDVEIYNLLGKKVFKKSVDDVKSTIDLGQLSKGMYLIKIFSDDIIITKKIIKIE